MRNKTDLLVVIIGLLGWVVGVFIAIALYRALF